MPKWSTFPVKFTQKLHYFGMPLWDVDAVFAFAKQVVALKGCGGVLAIVYRAKKKGSSLQVDV